MMKLFKKRKDTSETTSPRWNIEKFEAQFKMESARQNSMKSSKNIISNKLRKTRQDKIFEQFFLIGVPPSIAHSHSRNVRSKVLIAYPPYKYPDIPIREVIENCLPTGNHRNKLSPNPNCPIQDEFVFQFSGSLYEINDLIYGVCVHVSTKDTSIPFYSVKRDKDRTFCFCLITRNPAFSVHFSFLTYLALWTVGHIRNLRRYDEIESPDIQIGEVIDGLTVDDNDENRLKIGHHPSLEVPISFQKEIVSYYTTKVTAQPVCLSRASTEFMRGYVSDNIERMNNKHHNFSYDSNDCSLWLKFPPVNDIYENSIRWASLDTLFSLLKPSDILRIISSICLEYHVLIVGSRLQEISMSVLALLSIIRPLKFSGIVAPVLPINLHTLNLLQAPTPFLFGAAQFDELDDDEFMKTSTIDVLVNLDEGKLEMFREIFPYPNTANVKYELKKLLEDLDAEVNEFSLPRIYKKTLDHEYSFSALTCTKIYEIICSPFQELLYSNYIIGFFVTDMDNPERGVTVFNDELFRSQIEYMLNENPDEAYGKYLPNNANERESKKEKRIKGEIQFWNEMISDSQMFNTFVEEKMNEFIRSKFESNKNDATAKEKKQKEAVKEKNKDTEKVADKEKRKEKSKNKDEGEENKRKDKEKSKIKDADEGLEENKRKETVKVKERSIDIEKEKHDKDDKKKEDPVKSKIKASGSKRSIDIEKEKHDNDNIKNEDPGKSKIKASGSKRSIDIEKEKHDKDYIKNEDPGKSKIKASGSKRSIDIEKEKHENDDMKNEDPEKSKIKASGSKRSIKAIPIPPKSAPSRVSISYPKKNVSESDNNSYASNRSDDSRKQKSSSNVEKSDNEKPKRKQQIKRFASSSNIDKSDKNKNQIKKFASLMNVDMDANQKTQLRRYASLTNVEKDDERKVRSKTKVTKHSSAPNKETEKPQLLSQTGKKASTESKHSSSKSSPKNEVLSREAQTQNASKNGEEARIKTRPKMSDLERKKSPSKDASAGNRKAKISRTYSMPAQTFEMKSSSNKKASKDDGDKNNIQIDFEFNLE